MSAAIDGEDVPVFSFVGELEQFLGRGQVNIGPIPAGSSASPTCTVYDRSRRATIEVKQPVSIFLHDYGIAGRDPASALSLSAFAEIECG